MNKVFQNNKNYTLRAISALALCFFLFQSWSSPIQAKDNSETSVTPFTVEVVVTHILCPGVCDGSALAVITGGTAPFTFLWNTGDTVQHLDWEPAGYYEVTVTDADGHTAVAGNTILEPDPIDIDLDIDYIGDCTTGVTANVHATATGGTPGYTYEWSTGHWGQTVTGLAPGDYWLTVTDANGCKEGLDFTINSGGLDVDVDVDPGSCGANDGKATAIVSGGTPPYEYLWQPGDIRTPMVSGLAPGTYTLYVRDALGCKGEKTFIVPLNGDLSVMAAGRNVSCGATNDGTAQAMATGGTPPYFYSWTNDSGVSFGNTSGINNLFPDIYIVRVDDSGGCSGSDTVLIEGPLMVDTDSTVADCSQSNGTATVYPSGGTPPYTYLWCDGQTTQTAVGYPGSICWVTVTDAAGCSITVTVIITEDTDLNAQITDEQNTTCGMDDGKATVTATGGTPPYTYLWCNGDTTATACNLPAAGCTVTVTDSEGCRAVATALIDEGKELDVNAIPEYSDCDTVSTSATAHVNGGTPPVSYLWCDGQTTQTAVNLSAGICWVVVTDSLGCMGTDTVIIGDTLLPITPDFEWVFLECFDNDSMRVQFNDLTGAVGADCMWDFGNGLTATGANPIVILTDSAVDVTLTKNLGPCSGSTTKTVILPFVNIEIISSDSTDEGCQGEDVWLIAVNHSPVPPAVTYDWFPDSLIVSGDGTDTVKVFSDSIGTHTVCVEVMNDLGCLDTICKEYTINPKEVISPDSIVCSQCDTLTIDFGGISNATWIFGDPTNPTASSTDDNPSYTYPDTGTYKVIIIPDNPCIDTICKTVRVEPLKVDFECEIEECIDTCILTLTDISMVPEMITGWDWTVTNDSGRVVAIDSIQNPIFRFTVSGTYTVTMTIMFGDSCVQTISKEKELNCFSPPQIGLCQRTVCFGDTVKLDFPGADPDLIFAWPQDSCLIIDSTGAVCFIAAKEDTTLIFDVNVTNINGTCTGFTNYTIRVPAKVDFEVIGDTIVCDTTSVELIAVGAGLYTYEWSEFLNFDPVFSTNDTVYISPGRPTTYFVRATDANGCTHVATHTVGNYQAEISITGDSIICIGDSTLLTTINGNSGDTLDYIWKPVDVILSGQGTSSAWVNPEDNIAICVEVINQYGCSALDTFNLEVKDANAGLEIEILEGDNGQPKDRVYCANDSTQLFATEGYVTYSWTPGSSLSDPTISDPLVIPTSTTKGVIVYEVTVTDEEGCMGSDTVEIEFICPEICGRPYVWVPNAFTPDGDGVNDVFKIRSLLIDRLEVFRVYNRWGEKVFETTDVNEGWNGMHDGEKVCPDVYGYYYRARCVNGIEVSEQGNVTVLK